MGATTLCDGSMSFNLGGVMKGLVRKNFENNPLQGSEVT